MVSCRLSLSDCTYQVIKPPRIVESWSCQDCYYLGKSKKGVYFALVPGHSSQLQVWVLKESCGSVEWVLEHDRDLAPLLSCLNYPRQVSGPWILQDVNYNEGNYFDLYNDGESTLVDDNFEWDSDNDVPDTEDVVDKGVRNSASILGIHPFKEIVFLSSKMSRGLAYHLNTSKVEELGNIYPKYYGDISGPHGDIQEAFMYTPCWME